MCSRQTPLRSSIVSVLLAAAMALAGCTSRDETARDEGAGPLPRDEGAVLLNSHYYKLVHRPSGITWNEAKAEAAARTHLGAKGHLVAVTSQAEMDFLMARLFPPPEQRTHSTAIWAGGYRDPKSARPDVGWTWVNGDPWNYTNWNRHQPDGMGGRPENVLSIGVNPGGKWNDLPPEGHVEKHYIVEYDGPFPK